MTTPPESLSPDALAPLLAYAAKLDLAQPEQAQQSLQEHFPCDGPFIEALCDHMRAGVEDGTLCNRGAMPVKWSRVFKATPDSHDLSADAVLMNGPGPRHRHPNGEIDLCFSEDGTPLFDGHPAGWIVYGPESVHVPTVSNGRMLILYLLPGGAIEFVRN